MSTLSLRKIKHDSSAVDNITLNSSGHITTAERLIVNGATTNTNSNWGYYINPKSGGGVGDFTVTRPDGNVSWLSIDGSGRVTMPYQPNFQSYLGTNWTFSSGSVVPFNTTNWNIGSHYNTSSYRFTAPVAGTYAFYTHTYTSVSSGTFRAAHFQFRVNGSARIDATNGGFSPDGGYSYHPAMNNFVTIRLSINDYVDFYLSGGDYGSGTIFSAGSTLCVFGGHLIA